MAEDVARAVGASGPNIVMIGDKECRPRPLSVRELTELEREALDGYKREYIRTFSKNSDLFPEELRFQILREKSDEAARWDLTNLPDKWAYDSASIVVNEKTDEWLKENVNFQESMFPERTRELAKKRIMAAALDEQRITEEEYQNMVGGIKPHKAKIRYVEWWITGCIDGMISMVWMCFKGQGITRDQIAGELGRNPALLASISREIEGLSVPQLAGN